MATVWISAPSHAYCVCTAGQWMARHMQRHGDKCGRHPLPGRVFGTNPERGVRDRVRRLMRLMRSVRVYQTPNTSKKHPRHKIYPYLLRGLTIDRPNRVPPSHILCMCCRAAGALILPTSLCCADLLYLVAIHCPAVVWLQTMRGMDWFSRKILSWRLSNSMEAGFCPLGSG
jgi:putative transposase